MIKLFIEQLNTFSFLRSRLIDVPVSILEITEVSLCFLDRYGGNIVRLIARSDGFIDKRYLCRDRSFVKRCFRIFGIDEFYSRENLKNPNNLV